ncbi:amidase [Siminovitchia acidinfaciens]|uniref:Amidase n=1 Tax=Siminovitchia acidinfaciens TaxID=2321395 RepID=A0A429Y8N9_9BACI|nr:amidase [Siminovitchia acidinfaciens]RST77664.1 amidase [Siminovitchia acidinfaciens]
MKTPEQEKNDTYEEDFLKWDLASLSKEIKENKLSPVEVTKRLLEKIAAEDGKYNAFITVAAEEAMEQAKRAESEIQAGNIRGPLHGVPIAIKDNIYTEGITTTMGSAIFKDHIPDHDATVVKKLKEAGAIILGKLNMHEVAFGTSGDRSFAGPVKNPHDLNKITGGSSSGSGAALAASLCYGALGTDTGGSIRIPASFTGTVGMKPTFGRVSNFGVFPLSWTLDHVGPMTKTVHDNAILMNVLAGYDENDPYSIDKATEDYTALIGSDINGAIVGVPSSDFFKGGDPEVEKSYLQAIKKFEEAGAVIKSVNLPDMEEILAAFRTTLTSEAYTVHEKRLQDFPDLWDDEVRTRLVTSKDTHVTQYVDAQQVKRQAIREFEGIFEEIDLLITPTVPILPVNIGEREIILNGSKIHSSLVLNRYTGPFNITGLPSLSMPCGYSDKGLPIGIQLTGKAFDEANIYRFASVLENRLSL